ncbi:hypothetical protein NDU88_004930 [Pleurodeles waltl]|uniref:Uncharacterized protein n=1 Tax=Pleurodeles waltl TaxID=8319 RepID=A0AAV7WX86_PLEWA|nr:hypothetical protein NDU88_004930 [Pleurodeles waltl]
MGPEGGKRTRRTEDAGPSQDKERQLKEDAGHKREEGTHRKEDAGPKMRTMEEPAQAEPEDEGERLCKDACGANKGRIPAREPCHVPGGTWLNNADWLV